MRTLMIGSFITILMTCTTAVAGGDGIDSTLALSGVRYATMGNSQTNPGALLVLDTLGVGTLVGPTGITGGFGDPGVPALAISSNGAMYAFDIGTASNLYKLDASTGAATLVAATGLSSPPAAAFAGSDVLFVVDITGHLHWVDHTNGSSTLIGATGVFVKGMAFHPGTGELWATDASSDVYRINTVSAAATLVGNTGLPPSPDIHFDQNGNLFGVSGGGIVGNSYISIDTATGAGTVLGPVGFPSVSGMAMCLDRVTTGIAGTPSVFAEVSNLRSYPNPFNPTTTISWELTRDTHVTLEVFDASGRLIVRALDERMSAGPRAWVWNGRDRAGQAVTSGVYFFRLVAGRVALTHKAVLLK